jgi:hypothetical protein
MRERYSEWVVPLPANVEPIKTVRGTLLIASRSQVRAFGAFEAYEKALPEPCRRELEAIVATSWVPVGLVHDHLAAIDSLGIDDDLILQGAMNVANKLHGVFLATLVKTVRGSGVGPLAGTPIIHKIWARVFDGGALGAEQVGPKDLRLAVRGNPLIRHRYHRVAIRTHVKMGVQIFSRVAHVREGACDPARGSLDLMVSWV